MMVLSEHTALTAHSAAAVFSRWADPKGWPEWDPEVREVNFKMPTTPGARGKMQPASGPPVTFSITAMDSDRLLTDTSVLPGTKLVFEHVAAPASEGTRVTVTVRVEGPRASLWKRILGRALADSARSSVSGLLSHMDAA